MRRLLVLILTTIILYGCSSPMIPTLGDFERAFVVEVLSKSEDLPFIIEKGENKINVYTPNSKTLLYSLDQRTGEELFSENRKMILEHIDNDFKDSAIYKRIINKN